MLIQHSVSWTAQRFRDEVDQAARSPEPETQWLALLDEAHEAYFNCSSLEVVRRRGWLLSRLAQLPQLDLAAAVIVETLRTAHEPYLLAAAASALVHAALPASDFGDALATALITLSGRDDVVDLTQWGGLTDDEEAPTAMDVVLQALVALAPRVPMPQRLLQSVASMPGLTADQALMIFKALDAQQAAGAQFPDCCAPAAPGRPVRSVSSPAKMDLVRLQNQDGTLVDWGTCVLGRPSVVAFFYTRCENPSKCSLTITKLGHLQQLLEQAALSTCVRVLAISYDSSFDEPRRLRSYAESRGYKFDEGNQVLRAVQGGEQVQRYFGNGVNFAGTLVNWHRVELFLLDAQGRISRTYERRDWSAQQVLDDLREEMRRRAGPARAWHIMPSVWALSLALLPKCPICGATYLSVTGIAALPLLDGWTQLWPLALALLLVNIGLLARTARISRNFVPLALSAVGCLLITAAGLAIGSQIGAAVGFALVAFGSILSVFGLSRGTRAIT